jgi:hypothetical protein
VEEARTFERIPEEGRIKKAQHQNEERKKSTEKPDSEELCNGLGLS